MTTYHIGNGTSTMPVPPPSSASTSTTTNTPPGTTVTHNPDGSITYRFDGRSTTVIHPSPTSSMPSPDMSVANNPHGTGTGHFGNGSFSSTPSIGLSSLLGIFGGMLGLRVLQYLYPILIALLLLVTAKAVFAITSIGRHRWAIVALTGVSLLTTIAGILGHQYIATVLFDILPVTALLVQTVPEWDSLG